MKRVVVIWMLLAVMLTGVMRVSAAEAEMAVQVRASKTEVKVGDTVEYTVLATGSGVVAMQFELRFPEGLSYVPNSGKTPEGLAQKLGVPAADWTELSKMFTFYNDVGITFAAGTEILRFSCVAVKEGTWDVELYELLPFDGDFQEFLPSLRVQTVKVTGNAGETKPSVPEVTVETQPPVTEATTSVEPSPTVIQTVTEPAPTQDQTEEPDVSTTEPTQDLTNPATQPLEKTEPETGLQQNEQPEPENGTKFPLWTILAGGVLLAACGVGVFLIIKKKCS